MILLVRWLITAAAVAASAYLVDGIHVEGGWEGLLLASLVVGLVNALIRPIVRALSCGLIILTLGLFILVINAGMLLLSAWLAQQLGIGFTVDSFESALLGTIIVSLVSFVLSAIFGDEREKR